MTRRLLATVTLAAITTGAFVGLAAAPASAEDSLLCIGGENQRRPGSYQGLCIDHIVRVGL